MRAASRSTSTTWARVPLTRPARQWLRSRHDLVAGRRRPGRGTSISSGPSRPSARSHARARSLSSVTSVRRRANMTASAPPARGGGPVGDHGGPGGRGGGRDRDAALCLVAVHGPPDGPGPQLGERVRAPRRDAGGGCRSARPDRAGGRARRTRLPPRSRGPGGGRRRARSSSGSGRRGSAAGPGPASRPWPPRRPRRLLPASGPARDRPTSRRPGGGRGSWIGCPTRPRALLPPGRTARRRRPGRGRGPKRGGPRRGRRSCRHRPGRRRPPRRRRR